MSSTTKMLKPCLGSTEELYTICGRGVIAADASVTSDDMNGAVLTKTNTGEYTITFSTNAKPNAVRSCSITVLAATAVDRVCQVVSISTSAIVFKTLVGATATNPAAACEFLIHIDCRKTGVSR